VAIPVGMLVALMVTAFGAGLQVPSDEGRINPTKGVQMGAFMALATFTMWRIASVGIAAEMLFMFLPWSLGWIQGTDALLARTLFWFTGHPIVYFWPLPAYIS
jgi:cytochrome c oxidase subunit 1